MLSTAYDVAFDHRRSSPRTVTGRNSLGAIVATLATANPTGRVPVTAPMADNPAQPLHPWGWGLRYRR